MSSVTQRRQYVCLILWQLVIILHDISVTCDRVPWKSVSEDFHDRIHQRSHLLESWWVPNPRPPTLYYAACGHISKLYIYNNNYTIIELVGYTAYCWFYTCG
jgi:hypothetical protein